MNWSDPVPPYPGLAIRAILFVLTMLCVFALAELDVQAQGVAIDPHIIEGEAGIAGCPDEALLTVAHVNSNYTLRYGSPPTWYGWSKPSAAAYHYSRYWNDYDDPTRGAVHLFSFQDSLNPRVRTLTKKMTLVFEVSCVGGTGVRGYR